MQTRTMSLLADAFVDMAKAPMRLKAKSYGIAGSNDALRVRVVRSRRLTTTLAEYNAFACMCATHFGAVMVEEEMEHAEGAWTQYVAFPCLRNLLDALGIARDSPHGRNVRPGGALAYFTTSHATAWKYCSRSCTRSQSTSLP